MTTPLDHHPVVSRAEWVSARQELQAKEKEQSERQDALATARRALPWVKVEKDYVFETTEGPKSLADLFDGRSQLFIYHFMFGPGWGEGCHGCSFVVDHLDGANLHLSHHDVSVVVMSRAPLIELLRYKKRMGWMFDWISSGGTDFNDDFQPPAPPDEESPGINVFYRNPAGDVFHTYSDEGAAADILIGAHNYLDFMPKGRNEAKDYMDWVRRHDTYTTR